MGRKLIIDSENTDLLNHRSIDYSSMPYKLKPDFRVHCIVCKDVETGEYFAFYPGEKLDVHKEHEHFPVEAFPEWLKQECSMVVGHNIINYDLLVFKLYFGMDYEIGYEIKDGDKLNGANVFIHDTLVMSKLLNPDRFGGHGIGPWGERLGLSKIDYQGGFEKFNYEMLYYCFRDVDVNERVFDVLKKEWGSWKWGNAYQLEKAVAELVTRQEHYGFKFNKELAEWCVDDLNTKMRAIEERVEPRLPTKAITKTAAKQYMPPKNQYRQDGSTSANMEKWLEKHNAKILEKEEEDIGVRKPKIITTIKKVEVYGKEYTLPMCPETPVVDEMPMTLADQEAIKQHLIEMGWEPTTWKDKDLTVDTKKRKHSYDKYVEAVDRYVESTLGTPYEKARCEHLKVSPSGLRDKLLGHKRDKPLKVLGSPTYTINQDKDICPRLEALGEQVDYVKDIVDWLTYRHRKNAIFSPASETKKKDTGWLSNPRINIDGRIGTPADTLGAATGRFTHKDVANIPRVTSRYGEYIRSLFGVEDDQYQIGYDADGIEARLEGHYCIKYNGQAYADSLTAPKPGDVHTVNAERMGVSRDDAKTIKYATTFGAQPPKIAKQQGWSLEKAQDVFNAFWRAAAPLSELKEAVEKWWTTAGEKKYVIAIDGRKLWTRSKHALLNVLFQSGAVICMKRAMVWLDKELRHKGFIMDPFTQDMRTLGKVMTMCQYHDEGQLSISKDLVTFKTFQKEEDAVQWKEEQEQKTDKVYSDIGDKNNKHYVAYSPIGELAARSVSEGGKYYNLRVPLTAGYMVEKTWAGCH